MDDTALSNDAHADKSLQRRTSPKIFGETAPQRATQNSAPRLLYGPRGEILQNPANLIFTKEYGCDPEADFDDLRINADLKKTLLELSRTNKLEISCINSGYEHITGGSACKPNPRNQHVNWNAVDIKSVNGLVVGEENADAKFLAEALLKAKPPYHPALIGCPWDLGAGSFGKEFHKSHIHLQFNRNQY